MLIFYFFKRFLKNFFIFFVLLILILSFGDMLTRLTILPSISSIPKLILLMIPLMSMFAIPIASTLSVFIVGGQLFQNNEILFFYFLPRVRKAFRKSIFIFIFAIAPLYFYLVFDFAPKSYQEGKEFIVKVAREHISSLDSGRFHYPASNFVIFFKSKIENFDGNGTVKFLKILLMYQDDKGQKYIMTAAEGYLKGDLLELFNGAIQNQNFSNNYLATFSKTQLSIEELIGQKSKEIKNIQDKHTKFLDLNDILTLKDKVRAVFVEYHCRIMKVLWFLILPFLAFFLLSLCGRVGSNNLVLSIFGTMLLFLFSYLHVNISRVFWDSKLLGFVFSYGILLFVFIFFLIIYKRRKIK